jgi:SAM-dependent methyltransferase
LSVKLDACPACSGAHQPFEEWMDGEHTLSYRICERCGLVFQSPRMSQSELDAFYAQGYRTLVQGTEDITDKDLRIQVGRGRHLLTFLERANVRPTSHLDIGASSGVLLNQTRERFNASVVGIEPGEAYRRAAIEQGLEYHADIGQLPQESTFDLISMIHVLEHLPDPVSYLKNLRQNYLAADGKLLIEVPNLFGHSSYEVSHLSAFYAGSLKRCLQLAGFRTMAGITHGNPRSPILRLYLTVLAKPTDLAPDPTRWRTNLWMVDRRRRFGTWFREMMSYRLPNWTWKEYPEL